MHDNLQLMDHVGASVVRPRQLVNITRPRGLVEAYIRRKSGIIVPLQKVLNGVTNLGFNALLDGYFNAGTQPTNFYLGLISDTGFGGLNAADTMASHSGWTEQHANYSQANRPEWTKGAASSKQVTNASPVDFSITVNGTVVKGIFVTTDNTKGGTAGFLWATALFSADQTLFNGDTLRVTYTVSLN